MQTAKASGVKQSPGNMFDNIYDAITRRAFELFEGNGRWFGHDMEDWFRAERELLHPLYLDLQESDGAFTVRAEVPGFSVKELEISLEPRSLKIAGKRETKEEEKKGKMIRSECSSDQLLRVIDLPGEVEASKASANLKDGVLTIEIPKAPHAKAVRIEPKAA